MWISQARIQYAGKFSKLFEALFHELENLKSGGFIENIGVFILLAT